MTTEEYILDAINDIVRDNNKMLERIEKKMLAKDDDVLVSCTEAARILGVNRSTVASMIGQRRLTKVTIGLSTGIRLSQVRSITNPS